MSMERDTHQRIIERIEAEQEHAVERIERVNPDRYFLGKDVAYSSVLDIIREEMARAEAEQIVEELERNA